MSKKNYRRVKGTRDLLPTDFSKYKYVCDAFSSVAELYGYERVETPAFEYLELLEAKNPSIKDQIYWFVDKGGRKIGLRFDLTVPVARIVAQNPQLPKPIRYYYFSRMWRYEEPQKLRYREFWQFGVELIGTPLIEGDAEVISLAAKCFEKVGLGEIGIYINDRILMENILKEIGIKANALEVFRIIDKIRKAGREELTLELKALKLKDEQIRKIFELVEESGEFSRTSSYILENFKGRQIKARTKALEELFDLLDSYGVGKYLNFDLSIVRGLDYYTSLVFEIYETKNSRKIGSSLCGGGRYDELIGIYAKEKIPATGFAMGIDRIIEALQTKKLLPTEKKLRVLVISDPKNSILLAEKLRKINIATLVDVNSRTLSKNLSFANKLKIDYVIIYKEREIRENVLRIKDMNSGKEECIDVAKIDQFFKKLLTS